MLKYNLNFQLGDKILFRKEINLNQKHAMMSLEDNPIKHLTALPIENQFNYQYFPRLIIDDDAVLQKLSSISNKLLYIRYRSPNYAIKLNQYHSFEDYLTKFTAKTRGTLKRKMKKASKKGFYEKVYYKEKDIDEFHKHACFVGEQTYQKKLFNSAIPKSDKFKSILKTQAMNNNFLGIILFIEKTPCAYIYCPIIDNVYQYSYLGHLPQYSNFSPGTVLQLNLLRHIYSQKLKAQYFDFTEGDGAHKRLFSTNLYTCCNCLVGNDNLANQFWFRAQVFLDALSHSLGNILAKLKIKQLIKKFIRQ